MARRGRRFRRGPERWGRDEYERIGQEKTDGLVPVQLPEEEARRVLGSAPFVGGRRIPWGSNYTFLVLLDAGQGQCLKAVYKPRDGERPLWDFPHGSLYRREYAAYLLSRLLGWPDVPPTVIRQDGPLGPGSLQVFVDAEPGTTYFDLVDQHQDVFLRFAIFDLVANNADRKGGHCLLDSQGRIWSIDHGLTFHAVFKLRTVMVEFWGQEVPPELIGDVEALMDRLESDNGETRELASLLAPREWDALRQRALALVERRRLPRLDPYRNVPWPWV